MTCSLCAFQAHCSVVLRRSLPACDSQSLIKHSGVWCLVLLQWPEMWIKGDPIRHSISWPLLGKNASTQTTFCANGNASQNKPQRRSHWLEQTSQTSPNSSFSMCICVRSLRLKFCHFIQKTPREVKLSVLLLMPIVYNQESYSDETGFTFISMCHKLLPVSCLFLPTWLLLTSMETLTSPHTFTFIPGLQSSTCLS